MIPVLYVPKQKLWVPDESNKAGDCLSDQVRDFSPLDASAMESVTHEIWHKGSLG